MTDTLTPEQQVDARTHDVMAFAYRDTDGKLYTIDASGNRVEAAAGATALSPEYQAIAEQTAALVINYDKIINLTPEERGILADIASGKRQVNDSLSAGVRDAWNSIRGAADNSGILPSVPGASLIGNAASAIGGTASGFTFIPRLLSDLAGAGSDVLHQFGGGHISRENAIAIGTAYASAREVAAHGRAIEPTTGDYFKGLFSSHFGSYLGAGLGWLLDKAVSFAEMIPGIGDWIKQQGWASHQTLAQHIESSMRDDDNVAVAAEMGELQTIGGRNAAETAALLTSGGTARDAATGAETTINPSDASSAAPQGPEGAATNPDDALANVEANQRSLPERVIDAARNADFTSSNTALAGAGLGGLALGVAGNGQALRGAAEGIARQHVIRPAAAAARLQGRADNILETLTNPQTTARTSRLQIWRRTPEQLAALEEQHATFETRAAAARATAEARAANAGKFTQAAQEELKGSNMFAKLWNIPRHMGRMAGDAMGWAGHHTVEAGKGVVARAEGMLHSVTGMFSSAPEAAASTAQAASTAGRTAHAAEEVAEVAAKAAPAAGRLASIGARLSRVGGGGRFGGLLRLAGLGTLGAAALITPGSAIASTGDDVAHADAKGVAIHGTEAAVMVGTIARVGLSRSTPIIGVVASGGEFANAAAHGDSNGMKSAGLDLGIMGGFAAAGAGLGLCGGPFAPLSVPAGAAAGATVGGLVVAGRAIYSLFSGDSTPEPQVAAAPTPAAPARPAAPAPQPAAMTAQELAAAHDGVVSQARMAVNRSAAGHKPLLNLNLGTGFARVTSTHGLTAMPAGTNSSNGHQSNSNVIRLNV